MFSLCSFKLPLSIFRKIFKKKTQQLLPEKQTNAKNSTEMFVKMINAFIKVRNEMTPLTFDSFLPYILRFSRRFVMGKLTRFFPAILTLRKWRFSRYCLFVKLNVIFRHIIADGDPTEEQLRLLLEEVSEAELPGHHHRLAETKQRHPGGRGQPRREARGVLEAARHRGGGGGRQDQPGVQGNDDDDDDNDNDDDVECAGEHHGVRQPRDAGEGLDLPGECRHV